MNVYCEQADGCTVVTIEGDVSVPESDQFRDFLMHRIEGGSRDLVLDFSYVPYVDSSGISALLLLLQAARKLGGDIRLAGINERIMTLFRQVGLHHVFRRFDTRDQGVESFNEAEQLEAAS
jgi:anti-sigma B factor antagonist